MKRLFLAVLICVTTSCAMFSQGISGSVQYTLSGSETESLKGFGIMGDGVTTRIDVETPDRALSILSAGEGKDVTILMHDQKMGMVIPAAQAKEMAKRMNNDKTATETPTIKETGKTETIAGMPAKEMIVTYPSGTIIEVWATDQLGTFSVLEGFAGSMKALAGKNLVPLRVIKKEQGKETLRMEAKQVSKDKAPAAKLAAPSDYNVMNMPAGMGR